MQEGERSAEVESVVGTCTTTLRFDDVTPVAPRGLGGLSSDKFGNGRLFVTLAAHGGLLNLSYWGKQNLSAPAFFNADAGSAWIKMFRMYVTVDGKRNYLTLNGTRLYPFGYRSRCTIDNVEFEHELILLPDALAQRVRVVRNPRGLPVQIEMMHHEAATAAGGSNRTWSDMVFEPKRNALIASCRDQNPSIYRGGDALAQSNLGLIVKDAPDATTWFGLGCDLPLTATRGLHERSKHYLVSKPAGGKTARKGAGYFLAIASDRPSMERRLKQLARTIHEECDDCIAQYENRLKSRPQVATGNPVLDSAFGQIPEAIQHMKLPDRSGAIRATLAGYFMWGWDGMTPMVPLMLANEPETVVAILRFWQSMFHPKIGIPHQLITAFQPRLRYAFPAQCQFIASIYHYVAATGDLATARQFMDTCTFILGRCRKLEVRRTGLVEGIALWPDFPEAMEEDGHDVSSHNNSLLYQGLRAMQYLSAALGDSKRAVDYGDWAKRLRASFVKYLYDEEKGYFISSCSSKTFKPRKHYCCQAIFWMTPFARELVSHAPERIARFMDEHLRSAKCLLSLPRWDTAWMGDGNQLGASYPPADYLYLNVHKLTGDATALDAWLGDVEWFWQRHTVPEAFTPEAVNEHEIGPDNPGCKQLQACSTWYACLYNGLAGLDFDHEGLTITPWGDRPLAIRNLKLRGFSVDLTITGKGSNLAALTLNGRKLPASSRKISWSDFRAGRNVLRVVRTITPPKHPVIIRADGLRVESVQTKAGGVEAHVAGDMSGELLIWVPSRPAVTINGSKARPQYDAKAHTLTLALPDGSTAHVVIR